MDVLFQTHSINTNVLMYNSFNSSNSNFTNEPSLARGDITHRARPSTQKSIPTKCSSSFRVDAV